MATVAAFCLQIAVNMLGSVGKSVTRGIDMVMAAYAGGRALVFVSCNGKRRISVTLTAAIVRLGVTYIGIVVP